MSIDEGKLNPGIEYQFEIIAYTAACLSQNLLVYEEVDKFEIYTNQDVPIFDDIIIKVKYKSQSASFVYMGQIKRYKKSKINFNKGKDKLDKYLKEILEIKKKSSRKPFLESLLENVPDENIEFFYFSNSFLCPTKDGSENPLEHPIVLDEGTYCYLKCDTTYKSIFPLKNSSTCYKLITQDALRYSNIFDKFHIFLNQPDHKQIATRIVDLSPNIISISAANDIINYIDAYLKESEKAKLTKHVFETHLLRLCLSSFIVLPTRAVKVNPQLAHIWNELVMQFDITIISTEMKSYIFGCLWQEVVKLYKSEFNWNEAIINIKNINNEVDISNNFIRLTDEKEFKHWIYIPDTITELLIEMWKSEYLPLVLSSNTNVSVLKKFRHLNKSFVILDIKDNIYNEVSSLNLKVFSNAANICGRQLGEEFLKKICISLQGREPVDVYSIVNKDIDLMKEVKCVHLLDLMKEREIYLKTKVLSDANTEKQIDMNNKTFGEHENVIEYISCEASSSYAKIKNNTAMNDNSIFNMQAAQDEKQIPIDFKETNLGQFCVDEDGNNIYFKNDTAVPIIGKCIKRSEKYINRYLRKATLEATIFNLKKKVICFVTGDLNDCGWMARNRNQIIQGSVDYVASKIEGKLEKDKNAIAAIKDDEIEELWSRVCAKECPLLYVKLENNKISILKYQNCQNLSSHISYSGSNFNERSFFQETSTGITIISGEPGSGKSTLLRSLFNNGDKHSSVLLCDLNDYRQSLLERNAELFKNPISFMLRREAKHSTYANRHSMYPSYLNFLQMFFKSRREQILFLDSFDEVLPVCQEAVLDFIKVLHKPNVRVVIASRSVMTDTLNNSFEVEPVKIENLDADDIKAYIDNEKLNENEFLKYPKEFQENPMFLNFLVALHHDNSLLPATITKGTLYNSIIKRHVERYYSKRADSYSPAQYKHLRKDVLDIHKLLAVAEIFGDKSFKIPGLVYNDLVEECIDTGKVKLGLISRFNDDGPVFLHRTFAEYLIAEWLSDNIGQEYVRDLYKQLLDDSMVQTRLFLDDILCENLRLHAAVLAADLSLVESLCSEGDNHLKEIDQLNRDALHLAAIYVCSNDYLFFKHVQNHLRILEIIVRHMKMKGLDFSNNYDLIRKLTWFHYVGLKFDFLLAIYPCSLAVTLEMYFVCTGRIKEGIICAIDKGMWETSIELLRRKIRLLPEYYDKLLIVVITENRCKELRQLIELKNYGNMKFETLCKACKDLSPVSTVSKCTNLRIRGGFTAFHIACIYGNINVVKELIKLGVELDATDDFKRTPIFYGIIQGSTEVVACLVEQISSVSKEKVKYGFDSKLYKKSTFSKTKSRRQVRKKLVYQPYLHISLQKNYIEIAKVLLENGFDINERNDTGDTALHLAVNVHNDTDIVVNENSDKMKLLLNYNPNCNVQNYLGETPLHKTIENVLRNSMPFVNRESDCGNNDHNTSNLKITIKNELEIIECLLKSGADTNIENNNGVTPLYTALNLIERKFISQCRQCENYLSNMLKILLKADAIVNHKTKNGDTALHIAAKMYSASFVQIVLDNGADVDIENEKGETALAIAAVFSDLNTRILLNAGADVNHRNKFGNTALHRAALFDQLDAAKMLLNNGADVDMENEEGNTALFSASTPLVLNLSKCSSANYVRGNNFSVGTLLLEAGADINHQNKLGETALHLAARVGRINIVKVLLHNNADKNVVNMEGHTPISVAKHYKKKAVVDILSK